MKKTARIPFRSILMLFLICAMIAVTAVMLSANRTHAGTTQAPKIYTSYEIKSGDTLRSIAESQAGGSERAVRDYMDEVCAINHIEGDRLIAGQHICIPTDPAV